MNELIFESSHPVVLRDYLKCISALKDEVTLVFSPEELRINEMDFTHVAMVNLILPNIFFDTYKILDTSKISLNLKTTLDLLNKIDKDDILKVFYDKDVLKMMFQIQGTKSLTRNKTISLMEPIEEECPQPKIYYKSKSRILLDSFKFAIEDLAKNMQYIRFESTADKLNFIGDSDLGHEETPIDKHSDIILEHRVEEDSKATYTASYLVDILKNTSKISEVVTLELSNDMPLSLIIELPIGSLQFWVAPCKSA